MKSPKGKIWSWMLFILLMLGLFGILIYLQNQVSQPPEPTNKPPVDETVSTGKTFAKPAIPKEEQEDLDQQAFTNSIVMGEDCSKILFDETLQQQCKDTRAYQEAIDNNDLNKCGIINDSSLKQSCLDQVYFALANLNNDRQLCENIIEANLKINCLDQLSLVNLNKINKAEDCNSIQNTKTKQQCLNQFYFADSLKKLDESGCNKIQNSADQDKCRQGVQQTAKVIALAEEVNNNEANLNDDECNTDECNDQRQYDLAFENKDLSYCNAIVNEEKKENCLQTQAISINQSYLRQALSTGDSSICNKILEPSLQSLCLTELQGQ